MKAFRFTLFMLITLAIVFASTQALASPSQVPEAQVTATGKVPGAMATQKAIEHATQGIGKPEGVHENFKGIVKAVDDTSLTLTLRDETEVRIMLGPDTRLKFPGPKDRRPSRIEVGMRVMVQALRDAAGNLTARRVMVIPGKPDKIHRVGTVTQYTAGTSITIQDKKGGTFTFELTDQTVILPEDQAGALGIGSVVTVIAPRDPATGGLRVLGIVVHPAEKK
jgi:hypothetical protein